MILRRDVTIITDDTIREERKTLAQRFRDSTLFLVYEIVVIVAAIIGLFLTIYAVLDQTKTNRATLEELRSSKQYRKDRELPLAERTLAEIEENSKARKAEAIVRAWSILTTPAPGNSGKVNALEYLASQGVPLIGIDLSCSAMDGIERQGNSKEPCSRPVYLEKLDLSRWEEVLLENANLRYANISGADFMAVNLSFAFFNFSKIGNDANLSDAWAWRDQKPLRLNENIIFCAFNPEIHRRNIQKRPDLCARP